MTDETHASIGEHLDSLRATLIRIFLVIGTGAVLSLCFYPWLLSLMTYPLKNLSQANELQYKELSRQEVTNLGTQPQKLHLHLNERIVGSTAEKKTLTLLPGESTVIERSEPQGSLVVLGPIDGFKTMLGICFWSSVILTAPCWLYFICTFVTPGLHTQERSLLLPICVITLLFLLTGLFCALFISIPAANSLLYSFNSDIGRNMWSLSLYYDYSLSLLFANVFVGELCALLALLVHYDVISSVAMRRWRRHIWVGIFILSALLTPPDIVTQLLLAIPVLGLYELILIYAKWRETKATLIKS